MAGSVLSECLNVFHLSQNIWSIRKNVDARAYSCEIVNGIFWNNFFFFILVHIFIWLLLHFALCVVCERRRAGSSGYLFIEAIDKYYSNRFMAHKNMMNCFSLSLSLFLPFSSCPTIALCMCVCSFVKFEACSEWWRMINDYLLEDKCIIEQWNLIFFYCFSF